MSGHLSLAEIDFVVVDTETTGGRADDSRIIEVAAFHVRDGIILGKFHSLINPGARIPQWITALTGIDDSMVKDAPRFRDIAPGLREFLERGVFVAHNAPFDHSFVQAEFARLGESWNANRLCTVRLARHVFPDLPSRSLGNLCEHLLIDIFGRHRAAGDAEATVYVLKHCLQLMRKEFGVVTWGDLERCMSVGPLKLPAGVTLKHIDTLPDGPGHYVLKDELGATVHKGRSKNVRTCVRRLFRASNRSEKTLRFRQLVRDIEGVSTTSN